MLIHPQLDRTLRAIAPALAAARQPWWILGSAAVALHGVDPGEIGDVDVLLDPRDCAAVFARLGIPERSGQPGGHFRSAVFQQWGGAALPVELFANFAVRKDGAWVPVLPRSRVAVAAGGGTAYVPTRAELVAILELFGRPKDWQRIDALNASGRFPSRSGSV